MTKRPTDIPEGEDAWITGLLDDMARAPDLPVPDGLMTRVLADAHALRPAPGGVAARAQPWWRQIIDGLGGGIAVGGLVAAAATGFVVGLGGLDTVGVETFWPLNYETYYEGADALTAFGWDIEEG